MKGRQIVISDIGGLEAAALLVDGRLEDFLLDAPGRLRPGAILRGICDRPMKGQGGMMLKLPDGETGFLRQGKGLAPGQPILVQVTGFATEGKAVPVTAKVLFKSRYAIVTPDAPGLNISRQIRDEEARVRLREIATPISDPDWGLILRSAAETAQDDAVAADVEAMTDLARAVLSDAGGQTPELLTEGDTPSELAWRDWGETVSDGDLTDLGIVDELDRLREASVPLSPGRLSIEPTRALVAVDVDTGGDTSPAAGLKANLAAARALPRELRLRGLGGQITIDTAPFPKGQRRQVESALRAALKSDPIETAIAGWTPLGHLELQRKRERLPLLPRLPRTL